MGCGGTEVQAHRPDPHQIGGSFLNGQQRRTIFACRSGSFTISMNMPFRRKVLFPPVLMIEDGRYRAANRRRGASSTCSAASLCPSPAPCRCNDTATSKHNTCVYLCLPSSRSSRSITSFDCIMHPPLGFPAILKDCCGRSVPGSSKRGWLSASLQATLSATRCGSGIPTHDLLMFWEVAIRHHERFAQPQRHGLPHSSAWLVACMGRSR